MSGEIFDSISSIVPEGSYIYGIVDMGIYKRFGDLMDIEGEERIRILFKPPYLDGFESAAPYLVKLELSDDELSEHLLSEGSGKDWFSLVVSRNSLDGLADTLRSMIVPFSEPHDKEVILRFYDPRNLENYLKIHSKDELASMFAAIDGFFALIVEDESGEFKIEIFTAEDRELSSRPPAVLDRLSESHINLLETLKTEEFLKRYVKRLEEIDFENPYPADKREYLRFVKGVYEVSKRYGLDDERYLFSLILAWHVRGRNFGREVRVIELLNREDLDPSVKSKELMKIAIDTLQRYEREREVRE